MDDGYNLTLIMKIQGDIVSVMKRLLLLLFLPFLISCAEQELVLEGNYAKYGTSDVYAAMSFPPYSNSDEIEFTIDQLKKLSVDRIRIGVDWKNREPSQGDFYWTPMDVRMNAAADNNISVMLTIGSIGPDWACLPTNSDGACLIDTAALTTFIEALLTRYDNIDKIQFGNEWEAGSEAGTTYTDPDSVEKFITYTNILYDAVQRISPDTDVVLGGITRTCPIVEYFVNNGAYPDFSGIQPALFVTVDQLNAKVDRIKADYDSKGIKQNIDNVLANANYDILDIHLYDDPENWPEYLSVLPTDKPIIVSEFGGPNSEFENTAPAYHAERMEDYIDAIESLPITEAYYFKLVETPSSYHKNSGLFYSSYIIKPARNVFARRLTPYW